MNSFLLLLLGLPLGALLGALGSLTGIGGGFLLMPLLLLLLPDQSPGALSVVTLTVVFFNALSGTLLSARHERIRYGTGIVYGLLSLPLVWVGIQGQSMLDRESFSQAFGVFLLVGAAFLVLRRPGKAEGVEPSRPRWLVGAAISLVIGLTSGFFGVGGGFLFVPLLALFLRYPVVQATATSQLIVGIGATLALLTASLTHPAPLDVMLLAGLVAGVLVGSPLGTAAAGRWNPKSVLRLLAVLLAVVGLRFLWPA